jgi:hypothetical protein
VLTIFVRYTRPEPESAKKKSATSATRRPERVELIAACASRARIGDEADCSRNTLLAIVTMPRFSFQRKALRLSDG